MPTAHERSDNDQRAADDQLLLRQPHAHAGHPPAAGHLGAQQVGVAFVEQVLNLGGGPEVFGQQGQLGAGATGLVTMQGADARPALGIDMKEEFYQDQPDVWVRVEMEAELMLADAAQLLSYY